MRPARFRLDVHIAASYLHDALRRDVSEGLAACPKEIPPKWFYDTHGSELFEQITRLPEYYLTRREKEILERRAAVIAELTRADTLIELGSGTSIKTRLLLDALSATGRLTRFVPFDVSIETLRSSAASLAADYPRLQLHAVAGDFERHLDVIPWGHRNLVVFLGSTIGNLEPQARKGFLGELGTQLASGDFLLIGVDLIKDKKRLEAAYNDVTGVTAQFNKNVLRVINRCLHADFDLERFAHLARYDEDNEWIEMLLEARQPHELVIGDLEKRVRFEAGERLRTEISAKFRRDQIERELNEAGFEAAGWWSDEHNDFALLLAFLE